MREIIVYFMYSYFFLMFCLPNAQMSYHFLSVWRTFSSQFRGGSANNKFFRFSFVWIFLFYSWRIVTVDTEFTVGSFLSALRKIGATSFCLPWFQMRNSLSFELCSSVMFLGNMSFLSGCSQDFFFIFSFQKFSWYDVSWHGFLELNPVWSLLSMSRVPKTSPRFSNLLGGLTRLSI